LKDKVAIVTGAARGIALAIAKRFVAEGAKVVLADVLERDGATAAKHLGGSARFVKCDVGDPADVGALVEAACKTFSGDIDILVNNAGIIHGADFLELKESDFDRVLRVNLKGSFLVGQAVAQRMVSQVAAGKKPGVIINMSSINSVVAIPNQLPYCVSKGGVAQLTRVMALALAPHGIRVNAVGPGSIMTEMLATVAVDRTAKRNVLSRTPLGRIAEPEEVASVAVFLASDDANYVTGETVFVDGGRLALNYTVPVKD
jgi:NAD(P)-dependent dehydrogenase (short-subunit alcohol dehydrogenase family)